MNNQKRWIAILATFAFLIIVFVLPTPAGLEFNGKIAIGLMIWTIAIWLTNALPYTISGFLALAMLAYFQVVPWNTMYTSFINMVFFFLIATFSITIALEKTTIPMRMANFVLDKAGTRTFWIIFGLMFAVTILSAIMSNVPSCVIGMGLGLAILKRNGDPTPGASNLGKCLMLAAGWGAMIGGFTTPAGTPHDLMTISLTQQATGVEITFLGWRLIAVPAAIFSCLVGTWSLTFFMPPEKIDPATVEQIRKDMKENPMPPMTLKEKILVADIFGMLIFWILSTWFPALNIVGTAIVGMVIMFLPGVDILDWKSFNEGVSWNIVMMVGTSTALAAAIMATGGSAWLVNSVFAGAAEWGATQFVGVVGLLGAFLHCIVPSGPAIVGLAVPPLATLAQTIGANVTTTVITFNIFATVTFLLPIDIVPIITYSKGYWKFTDMIKAGVIPTIALILFMTFIMPFWTALIGAGV
jgi:sodium-dependent dicarboxylate transporter 2/3/5